MSHAQDPQLSIAATRFAELDTACDKDGWKVLGVGGGGCVHALTINPNRPDTILVSCDMTAGYITHDGGQSWRIFNCKSRLYSFAFDPVHPDVIYAGSSGLFRSEDNGQTWNLLFPDPAAVTGEKRMGDEANHSFISTDNWPGGVITAIEIDPQNSQNIYLAIKTKSLSFMSSNYMDEEAKMAEAGTPVFFSSDYGRTWQHVATVEGGETYRMFIDSATAANAQTLYVFTNKGVSCIRTADKSVTKLQIPKEIAKITYASCGLNPDSGKTVFYLSARFLNAHGVPECSVWCSNDHGASWSEAQSGLNPLLAADVPADMPCFSQVSTCARDARTAYLIVERFPEMPGSERIVHYGLLKSTDSGRTWNWVVKMDDDHDPDNRVGGWAERDYGSQWDDYTEEGNDQITPKGRFAWDVVVDPNNPNVAYSMDFSTVFRTADGGRTWEQLVTNVYEDGSVSSRGIDVLSAYSVFFDPFDKNHLVLPHTDVGMWHSLDGGRTWRHALKGVPRRWINTSYWVVFDPDIKGKIWSVWSAMHDFPRIKMFQKEFFGHKQGGVCRSDDGCETWTPTIAGLPNNALTSHIVLDPKSPTGKRTLYITIINKGVYKSTDDGATWVEKSNGIDPSNRFTWRLALLPDGTLYCVVVAGHVEGDEKPGALYKSTDGAETWQKIALPKDVIDPNDLTFDPDGRLYLSCWPHIVDGKNIGGGVYASDDGVTWANIYDSAVHVYTVTVDPQAPSTLYMTTFHASALRSDDKGMTWKRLKGANFQWNQRCVPDPHHPGMLYMTTFGCSLWYGPANGVEDAVEDVVNLRND